MFRSVVSSSGSPWMNWISPLMRATGAIPRTRCTSLAFSLRAPRRILSNVHTMLHPSSSAEQTPQPAHGGRQPRTLDGQQEFLGFFMAGMQLQARLQAAICLLILAQRVLAAGL